MIQYIQKELSFLIYKKISENTLEENFIVFVSYYYACGVLNERV